MTPTIVTTSPTAASADSASPLSTPTSTGSAAPLAEIGATMLIVPIASACRRSPSALTPQTPAASA